MAGIGAKGSVFMSKFMLLDEKEPATLGAVLEAVTRLSTLGEARILELVSAGRIGELFPFKPAAGEPIPADTAAEEELVEAGATPLTSEQREALIHASLPHARRRRSVSRK
jgi:hypothetical protein